MLTSLDILVRLLLGVALGAAIGIERQWHQKMAGLRTNALVALGAAGFVVYGNVVAGEHDVRMAAQIVSGIGFLGAGVILREGVNVHGLNTAATLWCSAMAGTLAGSGYPVAGVMAAALVVATNLALRPLTRTLNTRLLRTDTQETHYTVELVCDGAQETRLRRAALDALHDAQLTLRQIDSEEIPDTTQVRILARAIAPRRADLLVEQMVGRLASDPAMHATTWTVERLVPDS